MDLESPNTLCVSWICACLLLYGPGSSGRPFLKILANWVCLWSLKGKQAFNFPWKLVWRKLQLKGKKHQYIHKTAIKIPKLVRKGYCCYKFFQEIYCYTAAYTQSTPEPSHCFLYFYIRFKTFSSIQKQMKT